MIVDNQQIKQIITLKRYHEISKNNNPILRIEESEANHEFNLE